MPSTAGNGGPRALPAPDAAGVVAQLERILSSRAFAECQRSQQFLRYVVEETLAGRAGRIKGVTIANEAFDFEDPGQAQTSTVVRVEAGRLRRRLEDYYAADGHGDPIHISIRKGSYVPTFEPLAAAEANRYQQPSHALPELPPWSRRFAPRPAHIAVLVMLFATAVLVWWILPHREAADRSVPEVPSRPAIAVLPFGDATSDGGRTALAAGLTEDIITDLSRLSGIDIIALSSVRPYLERKATPQQIRRELGVTHVLYGSIRGTPDQLRVTAQLYETESGNEVWAQRFDRKLTDPLALQDELAVRIVEGMAVGFRGDEREPLHRGRVENAQARALYRQALDLVNPPNDVGRLLAARRAFERVIEIDPDFAGGYAGAGYTHAFMVFWGRSESPEEDTRKAFELSERALELDPSFGLAYSTQAFAYQSRRDFDNALAASSKSIEVEPNDPYVSVYYAAVLLSSGEADRGIDYAKRALRLDPLAPRTPYLNILGIANFHAGNYQEALDAFRRNIERGGPFGAHIQCYVTATYAHLGRIDEARENLETLRLYKDGFSWEDWIRRWMKEPEEAERLLAPLRTLSSEP
ncbi:MAG: hypothetical protein U9Q81_07615 [Pseudomonadota bacterium]|nr:hypothetical protein [Pseudomonadota bacterium]